MSRLFVILSAVALVGAANPHRQSANTTKTVLTTIFEGDTEQSDTFLTELGEHYSSFLNHWVTEGFCTQTVWGDAAERACRGIHAQELHRIGTAQWTQGFHLSRAEFNRYLGDKNVGTYNFTREVEVLPQYRCEFTMQITAILNVPQTPVNQEFFAECEER